MCHTIPVIGRLQPVDLREVWPSESYNFTPWLAQTNNLEFLAASLGLPGLELVKAEHAVDSFSAYTVARIIDSDNHVLIGYFGDAFYAAYAPLPKFCLAVAGSLNVGSRPDMPFGIL